MKVASEQVLVPSDSVAYRNIGGNILLVDINENVLLRLNETGSYIWEEMQGKTIMEISEQVSKQFDVDSAQAESDTLEFLQMLYDRGFVKQKGST